MFQALIGTSGTIAVHPMGARESHLPPAEAGSLQLTPTGVRVWPNDCGPAETSPATGTEPWVLTVDILPWHRFLPGTRRMFSWKRAIEPFAPAGAGVPEHTDSIPHERRAAFIPAINGWGFLPDIL